MKSNASLLTFLTISHGSDEQVIFLYLKQLEEIAPEGLFWYDQRGKGGSASFLWTEKKLRQWSLIGCDEEIKSIFDNLINDQKWMFKFPDVEIYFTTPKLTKKPIVNEFMLIESICPCDRNEYPEEYTCHSWGIDVSFLLNEKNNCNYLEGYAHNKNVHPIKPSGLLSKDFLFSKLKDGVAAVYKKRGIYYTVSGDRKDLTRDPQGVRGFIQAPPEFKQNHRVVIKNIEGTEVLGYSDINVSSGTWDASLSKPIGKGQFVIQRKSDEGNACGEKFYFIKNIEFQPQIVTTVLVDLYKREISITDKVEKKEPIKTPITWDAAAAPESTQAEIELSDKITDVLLSLGDTITINDPYFLGNFEIHDGNLKVPSKGQLIFLNSLIVSIAKGNIKQVSIVGSWSRVKGLFENKDDLIQKYKLLYRLIKNNFKNSTRFKLEGFNLYFSDQLFHDRYWLAGSDQNVVYHVSNSITGLFESGELRISLVNTVDTLKLTPRISERMKNPTRLS